MFYSSENEILQWPFLPKISAALTNTRLLQVQKAPQCPTATPSIIARDPNNSIFRFESPWAALEPLCPCLRAGLSKPWSASNATKPSSAPKRAEKSCQNISAKNNLWQCVSKTVSVTCSGVVDTPKSKRPKILGFFSASPQNLPVFEALVLEGRISTH